MTAAVAWHIRLPVTRLLSAFRGPVLSALLATGLLRLLESALPTANPILALTMEGVLAASAVGLFVYLYPGLALSRELAALAQGLLQGVPALGGWMKRVNASYPAVLSSRLS
jgi:hypothetical protein